MGRGSRDHTHHTIPYMCRAEGVCTMVDTLTGRTKHIFQKKYRKEHKVGCVRMPRHQVGGPGQSYLQPMGMRFSSCLIGDLCQGRYENQKNKYIFFFFQLGVGAVYDHTEFRHASSKKELCSTTKYTPNIENSTKTEGF